MSALQFLPGWCRPQFEPPPNFRVLEDVPHVDARFFTAEGGFSTQKAKTSTGKPGLNCALGGDDSGNIKRKNRSHVAKAFGVNRKRLLTTIESIPEVTIVENPWTINSRPSSEAMVMANMNNYVLGLLSCDCAPILLADRKSRTVAAVHAGWRATMEGILEKTMAAMEQLSTQRADIAAAIGPCAGAGTKDTYEVRQPFVEQRINEDPDAKPFFECIGSSTIFRFQHYLKHRLERAGVGTVEHVEVDTISDLRCYSSRRGTLGLMFSGIKLTRA